ncbi:hypothetical protein M514_09912 [Trichuris suis]|uniref:receptor protein-tyrosine kinase n=1 Tax=Trichuris suis TaxID=68888 RepID=A0A085N4D5_9BILA|nr:hypothetical protein M514_09912 [Trichuris suis]
MHLFIPAFFWTHFANILPGLKAYTEEHQQLKEGESLSLSCPSNSIVDWRLPDNSKYEGFSDPREDGRLHIEEAGETLHISPLISTDTGYYECSNRVSSDGELFEQPSLTLRRWYVYVEGEEQENGRIFLHWKNATDKFSHLIAIPRSQGGYIDCLVTSNRASVSLIFDGKRLKDVHYEPARGFFVKEADLPRLKSSTMQSRMGACEARIGHRTDTLYFLLLVVSDSRPLKPWISRLNPPYPYAKGPMEISCLNKFEQSFQGSCSWSFPAENERNLHLRLTITEVVTPSFNVTLKFKYVLENDSGLYVCSCKLAENGKTAEVTKNIIVSRKLRKIFYTVESSLSLQAVEFPTDLLSAVYGMHFLIIAKRYHCYYARGRQFVIAHARRGYLNVLNENVEYITENSGSPVRMIVKYEAWPLEDVTLEWFHHYVKVGEPFQKVIVNESDPRINKYGNVHGSTQERALEITNAKVTDGGSYICFVTVASVSTMVEFKVSIFSPPIIVSAGIAEPSGFTASIDGRFLQYRNHYSIVCRAYGFPLPKIQLYSRRCLSNEKCEWIANESLGNSLRNSSGELFEGTYETSFRLPVIAKQTGSYICFANGASEKPRNAWKSQENKIIDFVVTDVPQAERFKGFNIKLHKFTTELTKENYATVFEEDSIALSCMYQKWYYKSVKWISSYARNSRTRKIFTAAEKHGNVRISHEEGNFSNSVVLHIFHVSPEYSGVYFCSATEGDSGLNVVRTYELVVQRPLAPFFHNENESTIITVQYSHSFELDCNASAFPKPKFEWLKNWTKLTPSPGIQILENGRRLKVLRAVKEDVGIYTCNVKNRAGATERNYTVSVEGLELPISSKNTTWIMQLCLGMLGCFVVALISVVIVLKRREQIRVKQLKEMYRKLQCSADGSPKVDPSLPLNEQTEKLTYDLRYEVPKQCLQLKECLGVGQFGRVHKATIVDTDKVNTTQLTVAVKMPRGRSKTCKRANNLSNLLVGKNVDHQSALLSELKIMVYLGFHPNVLSLVGAVTKHMVRGELYVITEFCSLGCLRDYVRQLSPGFVNELVFVTPRSVHPTYDSTENDYLTPYMSGKKGDTQMTHYQSEVDPTWADELARNRTTKSFLCTTDLLSYSYQVANGMDFLASKNVIHRDLALRNLLLTENHLVKIGDFGLTRQDNKYEIKKLDTPLPIKWMAIESLSYREYTVKSDVWSFGIVLWEIFSHGTIPYTEHDPGEEFIMWLKSGNRLSQPDHSPEEIYRLMRHCWLSKPEDRPDFAACRQTIADQLSRCNASTFESLREDLENAQPQILPEELRNSEPFKEPYCDFFYRKDSTIPNDEPEASGLDNATYFNASTLQC